MATEESRKLAPPTSIWASAGSWAAIATLFVSVVVLYSTDVAEDAKQQAYIEGFVAAAEEQHDRVNGELKDLRRNEIESLAEENDDQQVAITRQDGKLKQVMLILEHQQQQLNELRGVK